MLIPYTFICNFVICRIQVFWLAKTILGYPFPSRQSKMAAKDLEDGLPEQAKPLDVLQEPRTSKESIPLSSCPTQARIFADIVATDPAAAAEQSPSRVEGLDRRATHESEASYSIFTHSQKIFIVLAVSFMAIISPLSGSAYLPALPEIAADLNVSNSLINLTVTTYLVCTPLLYEHMKQLLNKIDLSRHRTLLCRQFLRCIRQTSSLCDLLCNILGRKYRSCTSA